MNGLICEFCGGPIPLWNTDLPRYCSDKCWTAHHGAESDVEDEKPDDDPPEYYKFWEN